MIENREVMARNIQRLMDDKQVKAADVCKTLDIKQNTFLGVFRPNLNISTTLPQKRKFDRNMPTTDDVKRILDASKGTKYHIPFQLAVLGMRRSEICAATIDDLNGNILSINKATIYNEDNRIMVRNNFRFDAADVGQNVTFLSRRIKHPTVPPSRSAGILCVVCAFVRNSRRVHNEKRGLEIRLCDEIRVPRSITGQDRRNAKKDCG